MMTLSLGMVSGLEHHHLKPRALQQYLTIPQDFFSSLRWNVRSKCSADVKNSQGVK